MQLRVTVIDMRPHLLVLAVAACSFNHGSLVAVTSDADKVDATALDATVIPDTANGGDAFVFLDAPAAVCGNNMLEPGEDCEVGSVAACATTCGDMGTQPCTTSCTFDTCNVVVDPATAWEVSANASTWTATSLPNVGWPCDNCTRYFRTTVCDQPTAVEFQWSSDNRARMQVNGTLAFDTYWLSNYCTDAPCCAKCCDSTTNCLARLSAQQTLDAVDLGLFNAGPNVMRWEVNEEVGGAGFYTVMLVRY